MFAAVKVNKVAPPLTGVAFKTPDIPVAIWFSFWVYSVSPKKLGLVLSTSTAVFNSDINPVVAVSQNKSNKDSCGSVSYTAKKGFMLVLTELVDVMPIGTGVETLPIKGFVSIW